MDKEHWKRDKVVPDVRHGIVIHLSPWQNSDGDPKRESSDTMDYNDCLPCEATDLELAQSM